MKSYALMLLAFMVLAAGCGNDDVMPSIAGSYSLANESTSGCIDPTDNGTETKACTITSCETLFISADGTFSIAELDNGTAKPYGGTYSLNANKITFSSATRGIAETHVVTFQISGTPLILTYEKGSDGCIDIDTLC